MGRADKAYTGEKIIVGGGETLGPGACLICGKKKFLPSQSGLGEFCLDCWQNKKVYSFRAYAVPLSEPEGPGRKTR